MNKRIVLSLLITCLYSAWAYAQPYYTLRAARALAAGTPLTVSGVVSTGPNPDARIRYFQDATGAMAVFAPNHPTFNNPGIVPGDSIVVSGVMGAFNGLQQIIAPTGGNVTITKLTRANNSTEPPVAMSALADSMREENEGRLMRFANCTFVNATGNFANARNYTFRDRLGREGQIRIAGSPGAHRLAGTPVPTGFFNVWGVLGEFNGTYQLLPRDEMDLEVLLALSDFRQENIFQTRFDIGWTTSAPADTRVFYRVLGTTNFDSISVPAQANVRTHLATVTGLLPATFYEVQARSRTEDGRQETRSPIALLTTASESTGAMKFWFNNSVDNAIIDGPRAVSVSGTIADTIATLIDRATVSVDVAVFNANLQEGGQGSGATAIIAALNRAHQRGVRVRYIADGASANPALAQLNNQIQVLRSPTTGTNVGIMHNKFVLIDPASRINSWVFTATANFTEANLNRDPNVFIAIQDQALARAYLVEFEEMWGSANATPGLNPRFGAAKTINTPRQFMIGGTLVELFFSPTDGTNAELISLMNDCQNNIRVATTVIANDNLANTLIDNSRRGWHVRGIIDNNDDLATRYDLVNRLMTKAQDSLYLYERLGSGRVLHSKYLIVDGNAPSSNPAVAVGSHNWSTNSDSRNDENMLVFHSYDVSRIFLKEFAQRFAEVAGTADAFLLSAEEELQEASLNVFPNPANDRLHLLFQGTHSDQLYLKVIGMDGTTQFERAYTDIAHGISILTDQWPVGVYTLEIRTDKFRTLRKVVISR